ELENPHAGQGAVPRSPFRRLSHVRGLSDHGALYARIVKKVSFSSGRIAKRVINSFLAEWPSINDLLSTHTRNLFQFAPCTLIHYPRIFLRNWNVTVMPSWMRRAGATPFNAAG